MNRSHATGTSLPLLTYTINGHCNTNSRNIFRRLIVRFYGFPKVCNATIRYDGFIL